MPKKSMRALAGLALTMTLILTACSSGPPLPPAKSMTATELRPEFAAAAKLIDQINKEAKAGDMKQASADFQEYQQHVNNLLPGIVAKDQKLAGKLNDATAELGAEFKKAAPRKSEVDEEYGVIMPLLIKAAQETGVNLSAPTVG
ncbi:MAG: hypothetical protein ACM3XM_00150 [Mycobacterium leprae]